MYKYKFLNTENIKNSLILIIMFEKKLQLIFNL